MKSSHYTIEVTLPHHRYAIDIQPGLLNRLGSHIAPLLKLPRVAILGDAKVLHLYQTVIEASFRDTGSTPYFVPFDGSESAKNSHTVEQLYQSLFELHFERNDMIVAFGGGVVGDLVGFVAATFLRGIRFIQVPTTLLAMVDASVGGKVGYNNAFGKNLIGAFHQPQQVLIDPTVLSSLPRREFVSGLAECIKHGVIDGQELLDWTGSNLPLILRQESNSLSELIYRNVSVKARIVQADEKEQGIRAHLNFGHTFAHAIEAASGYGTWLHGEAVALGMVAATATAVIAERCDARLLDHLTNLVQQAELPTIAILPGVETLMQAMQTDKKVHAGKLRLVLPRAAGDLEVTESIPLALVHRGWELIRNR